MKKYFWILLAAATLTSCKKWLDVKPESQIPAEDLFQTQDGFQEALNGVYTRCAQNDLYGDELLGGTPEALAQNYTYNNDPLRYKQTALFNYKDPDFIIRKDNIWKGLYNGIVNANLILENIDQKKSIFTSNNYAIIKGEALALRAYLHFDVFRLFGDYDPNGTSTGIPYVTSYSNKITGVSTAQEALNNMITDLTAAKALLKGADSILNTTYKVGYPSSPLQTENTGSSLFQQNRRHRLNYYAVCGELARVYLYKKDKVNALSNAEEVISSNKFPWTAKEDFINVDVKLKDRILYKELVFGWYLSQKDSALVKRFDLTTNSMSIQPAAAADIYEKTTVGGDDNRYKQWIQESDVTTAYISKYKRNTDARADDDNANIHPLMAPGIRLSEMYYIAAECSYATNPSKALSYFDKVRFNRGIGTPLTVASEDQFVNELLKEARKEWYAEGQLFYMYKRLNKSIIGQQGIIIPASKSKFILPLPNDEIEFGGR